MEENHIGHTFLSIDKFKQKLIELIQNSQNSENNKLNEKGFNIDKLQKKLKNIEEESRINGLFFQKEFFALQNKIQNINSQIEKKKNTKNLENLFFSKETDNFEDSNNLKEIINLIELDYDEGAAHFRKKSFSEQEIKDFNKDFQNYNDYYEILQSKLKSITVEIKNLLNFQLFLDNKPKFLENIQDFDENDDNVESSEDESIMSQSGKQKRVKLRNSWWEYIGICLKEKYLEKNEVQKIL